MSAMIPLIDPPWLHYAKTKLGLREVSGAGDNPYIVDCLREAGLPPEMLHDSTAWCGSFANKCLKVSGHKGPPGPAAARHWALPCKQLVQLEEPVHGCILVFNRPPNPKQGHIGFWDAADAHENDWFYNVLGGNEDNSVKIKPYQKNRYIGSFWPADYPLPPEAKLFQHPVEA